jgi:signal recognition particle receptor subunit beta
MNLTEAQEIKIVFSGPMGAGKTTAIATISEIAPLRTEVENNDRETSAKETTTAALDYGQLTLADGTMLRLYGTPGQDRFEFMWSILGQGALGVIVLLDGSRADALAQLKLYLKAFSGALGRGTLVIGVGRSDHAGALPMDLYKNEIERGGRAVPIFRVDVRRREDVLLLIETLMCQLEISQSWEGDA